MTEQPLDGRERTVLRRALGPLCAALLLMGTTVGCSSDNPAPQPLDQSTEAASSTPSETPEPAGAPTLPPEAKGTSDKAAIAFVEHWVETLNYSMASGDSARLERLADRDCETCGVVVKRVAQVTEANGSLSGRGWRIRETQYLAGQPRRQPVVRAVIDVAPQVVVEREGAEPQRFEGGRVLYTFHLQSVEGRWRVQTLERAT